MKLFEPSSHHRFLSRLLVFYSCMAVWGIAVTGRLLELQFFRSEEFYSQSLRQQSGYRDLKAKRGEILDRNLKELAISIRAPSLEAYSKHLEDIEKTAQLLSPILRTPAPELHRKLLSNRNFVSLSKRLTPRQEAQIISLNLSGIGIQTSNRRFYPENQIASHVLGYVGDGDAGLSGLEYHYDKLLSGKTRRIRVRVDARRQSFESELIDLDTQGNTLVLSLDSWLQFLAESTLENRIQETGAKSGTLIAMDPKTGDVLAMASYPSFDPNFFSQSPEENRRNRAIAEIYEPGSTFKVVPLAAVLNENLSEPTELINCAIGSVRLGGKVYREAERSFGLLTLEEILAKSSNVGAIQLALRLGDQKLHDYVRRFGFGSRTGIDLPGEERGIFRGLDQWSALSVGALSIGQELAVTPLQVLRAVSVFASEGYLVKPRMVRKILTPRGELLKENRVERSQIIAPESLRRIREAMGLAVEEGTAQQAKLNGYTSAGKTGTAQKFVNGQYSSEQYIASFVGFAPLDEPAIAAIVVINEPSGEYYGGRVAAPAFKTFVERALLHLRVPPDRAISPSPNGYLTEVSEPDPPPDLSVKTTVQTESGPEDDLKLSLRPSLVRKVVSRLPEIPDFSGMSLREAATRAADLNLQLKVFGRGMVVAQRPEAGTPVIKDMVCELFFSTDATENATGQLAGRFDYQTEDR